MKTARLPLPSLLALASLLLLLLRPTQAQEPTLDGPTLAAQLRAAAPTENWQVDGSLEIRSASGKTEIVPVTAIVTIKETSWEVSYESKSTQTNRAEKLVIVHHPDRPNDYLYSRAPQPQAPLAPPKKLSPEETFVPFAGSDFWLVDLGLDFFHWPGQDIVDREMRKGRSCKVLESRQAPATKNLYLRVLSWVDNETGGLIMAEAYDPKNKLLKEFEVRSFKKIEDRWELQAIQIRNLQTRSRTRLEFAPK